MTACAILLGLIVILKFTPDIAMARWLSRWCVEKPAAMLNRFGRGQMIGGMALILLICVLIHAEAGEALHLLGMSSPEIVMLFSTFEISVYADLLATGLTAWFARPGLSVRRWMGTAFGRRAGQPRPRARRRRRRMPGRKAANDDEPGYGRIAA